MDENEHETLSDYVPVAVCRRWIRAPQEWLNRTIRICAKIFRFLDLINPAYIFALYSTALLCPIDGAHTWRRIIKLNVSEDGVWGPGEEGPGSSSCGHCRHYYSVSIDPIHRSYSGMGHGPWHVRSTAPRRECSVGQ